MSLRTTLTGFLVAAAVALGTVSDAGATTIAPLTHEQITDAATYVVRGTVTSVWTEVDEGGRVWTRAGVEVERTLKGPDQPDWLVVDAMGGTIGQTEQVVPSRAKFSEGEQTLLFLAEIDHGRRLTPVGMYLGKFTIRRAPQDARPHVVRFAQSGDFDHRFLPHPPRSERLYLDDLLETVESRLQTGWDGKPIPGLSETELETINAPARRLLR